MMNLAIIYPDATPAQAFEHTRVGGWRQYTRSPYKRGHEPPINERVDSFLEACVKWERAWEVLVHTGLVHDIEGDSNVEYRVSDAARRIAERAWALAERITKHRGTEKHLNELPSTLKLSEGDKKQLT